MLRTSLFKFRHSQPQLLSASRVQCFSSNNDDTTPPSSDPKRQRGRPRKATSNEFTEHEEKQPKLTEEGAAKVVEEATTKSTTSAKTDVPMFEEGEYVEPAPSLFISEKIGEFELFRREGSGYTEIIDLEIRKETKIEAEKAIHSRLNRLADKFDLKNKGAASPLTQDTKSPEVNAVFSKFKQAVQTVAETRSEVQVEIMEHRDRFVVNNVERDAQVAFKRLEQLVSMVGEDAPTLKGVSLADLRRSRRLRQLISEYTYGHFIHHPTPKGSMEKQWASKRDELIGSMQSFKQSQLYGELKQNDEVGVHNAGIVEDFAKGDEGIDHINLADGTQDPTKLNEKKLERELRAELKIMAAKDPILAEEYEEFLFSRNEVDDIFEQGEIPMNEVKTYPGSAKGHLPEDDPESYSRWFFENQPESMRKNGTLNANELGVKKKFIRMTRDDTSSNEVKTPTTYFFEQDELYPMQNYDGAAEFELFDRDSFNVADSTEIPKVIFMSSTALNELAPQQSESTMSYHLYQPEIEKWAIFRSLPQMIAFDRSNSLFFSGLKAGSVQLPNYHEIINPPSLWAYYLTLPEWCRDSSLIRNILYSFEYHKPAIDIRQKELAMNLACSYLRPIEGRLLDVISEVAGSNKIRMNVDLGKQMMNELRFYTLDMTSLGDETDEDGGEDQVDITALLAKGIDGDDEANRSLLQKAVSGTEEEERAKERKAIYEDELNISEFQVDPEVEQCMTDFPTKGYAGIFDVESPEDAAEPIIPVNFYDNDDGFWNDYIVHKETRWEDAGFLTNRKFFKH